MFPAGRETATRSERQIFSTSQKVLSVLVQIRQDINLTCWQPIRRNLSGNLPQGDTALKQTTTETSAEKESGKASFTNVNTEISSFFFFFSWKDQLLSSVPWFLTTEDGMSDKFRCYFFLTFLPPLLGSISSLFSSSANLSWGSFFFHFQNCTVLFLPCPGSSLSINYKLLSTTVVSLNIKTSQRWHRSLIPFKL